MAFSNYTSVTLADLGEFSNGVNFGKDAMGSGFGVINVNDIFRSGIRLDFAALDKVDLSNLRRPEKFTVTKHDLFFVRSSVKRDGVGLVSYSPISDATVVHCGFVIRFRVRDERANPIFLAYAMRSPFYRETLKNLSSGTAIINISQASVGSVTVDLPPRNVQDRIASILSAYDDLIENNTRHIRILEQMAQMIYREWFVNLRFPGHENLRMVDSELGPIPEGWTPTRLGDLCAEKRRAVNPNEIEPNTPYIGLEHLPRKSIALGEWGRAGDVGSTKLRFNRGEILFGKIRPYFHKVGVAPVDGVASSDAIVIVPSKTEYLAPVLCCVSTEDFVSHATQTSQGTKMPRANWDLLKKYPLPLPEPTLLNRFIGVVQPIVELLQNLIFRNRNLRSTRDLLLPKLISGEVSVEAAQETAAEFMEQTA